MPSSWLISLGAVWVASIRLPVSGSSQGVLWLLWDFSVANGSTLSSIRLTCLAEMGDHLAMHADYLVGLVLEYLEVGGRTLSPVVLVVGMLNMGIQMAAMFDSSLVDHIHHFDHNSVHHVRLATFTIVLLLLFEFVNLPFWYFMCW